MTFEEMMSEIEKLDNGAELLEVIKERISKLNNENKNLRARAKASEQKVKDMEENSDPLLSELAEFGFEITEDQEVKEQVRGFLKSFTDKKSEDVKKSPDFIKLEKEIKKLQLKNEENEKAKAMLEIKSKKAQILNELSPLFSENILNGNKLLKSIINSEVNPFSINEEGKVAFKLDDGDEIVGAKAIIDEYKKQNPDEVLNTMKSGVASKTTHQTFEIPKQFKSIDDVKKLTDKQIASLSPEQYKEMMQIVQNNMEM